MILNDVVVNQLGVLGKTLEKADDKGDQQSREQQKQNLYLDFVGSCRQQIKDELCKVGCDNREDGNQEIPSQPQQGIPFGGLPRKF